MQNTHIVPTDDHLLNIGQVNILNNREGFEYRYNYLGRKAQDLSLDIVSMQEVSYPHIMRRTLEKHGMTDALFANPAPEDSGRGVYVDSAGIGYNADSLYQKGIEFDSYSIVDFSWLYGMAKDGILAKFKVNGKKEEENNEGTGSRNLYIYSGHFVWHMTNEWIRMIQFKIVSAIAEYLNRHDPGATFVLTGDLNTDDDSAGYTYLTGRSPGISLPDELYNGYHHSFSETVSKILPEKSYLSAEAPDAMGSAFVDAYTANISNGRDAEWATTDQGNNHWGRITSSKHNTKYPQFLPQRRIDYILVYGWVFGKEGYPLSYHRFGDPEPEIGLDLPLSDHYGIMSEIII